MADYFGTTTGYHNNKCKDINVKYSKGTVLKVPILDASPWVYECQLTKIAHQGDGATYFGEIKNILVDEKIGETSYGAIDLMKLNPLSTRR